MTTAHPLAERSEQPRAARLQKACDKCGRGRFKVFVTDEGGIVLICISCGLPQHPRRALE